MLGCGGKPLLGRLGLETQPARTPKEVDHRHFRTYLQNSVRESILAEIGYCSGAPLEIQAKPTFFCLAGGRCHKGDGAHRLTAGPILKATRMRHLKTALPTGR
jgi:hypothetical protein